MLQGRTLVFSLFNSLITADIKQTKHMNIFKEYNLANKTEPEGNGHLQSTRRHEEDVEVASDGMEGRILFTSDWWELPFYSVEAR